MTVKVLQAKADVQRARERLVERGASCLGVELKRTMLQRLLRESPARVGDVAKSWDVLQTAEYVESHHPKSARVLDLGAYCSELLCVLHRLGFASLTGIDLNPGVRRMPFGDTIRWDVGNFLHAPYADRSFDVIASVSVIEHGLDVHALLRESSRLLAPGGSFVASFDYWPEKLDTSDTKFFGLDWRIFSRAEVESFLREASGHGFELAGTPALDASERTVTCAGRDYTFGWMAMRRA